MPVMNVAQTPEQSTRVSRMVVLDLPIFRLPAMNASIRVEIDQEELHKMALKAMTSKKGKCKDGALVVTVVEG